MSTKISGPLVSEGLDDNGIHYLCIMSGGVTYRIPVSAGVRRECSSAMRPGEVRLIVLAAVYESEEP